MSCSEFLQRFMWTATVTAVIWTELERLRERKRVSELLSCLSSAASFLHSRASVRGTARSAASGNPAKLRFSSPYWEKKERRKEKQNFGLPPSFHNAPSPPVMKTKAAGWTRARCNNRSEKMALWPGNGSVAEEPAGCAAERGNLSVEVGDHNMSCTNRSILSRAARARGKNSTQLLLCTSRCLTWIIQAEVLNW